MKSTQKSCLFALFLVVFGMSVQCLNASNLTPIALWSQYGASRPGVNINLVTASWDPDGGAIQAYKWCKNNILVSQSSTYNFTQTLEEGEVNKVITINVRLLKKSVSDIQLRISPFSEYLPKYFPVN